MVGDRYRKRAKNRKRDLEREKDEWSDDDGSELEEQTFLSQRKMRKASKEEGNGNESKIKSQPEKKLAFLGKKKKSVRKRIRDNKTKGGSNSKSLNIQHDEKEQWFTIDLPKSGDQAFLQYSIEDDGRIDLWHTEVPESARGAGIGGQLAKAALDWAAARKILKDQIANQTGGASDQKEEEKVHPFVVLSCSFLKRWHHLNPMPEHANVVVGEDS